MTHIEVTSSDGMKMLFPKNSVIFEMHDDGVSLDVIGDPMDMPPMAIMESWGEIKEKLGMIQKE